METTEIMKFRSASEETLQSIERTLKRIELILLLEAKIRLVSSDAQAIVEQLLKESSAG